MDEPVLSTGVQAAMAWLQGLNDEEREVFWTVYRDLFIRPTKEKEAD
jgi:hypothetical protein